MWTSHSPGIRYAPRRLISVVPSVAGALPSVRISRIRPFSISTAAPATALGSTQSMSVAFVRRVRMGLMIKGCWAAASGTSAELGKTRQDLLAEQCQVIDRVVVSDVATLAHHQEVAEAADVAVKRLDLLDHRVRRAREADAGVDKLLDARPVWVDLPAIAQRYAAHGDA